MEDLNAFVQKQRQQYYLWRRPVLAFDSYELTGALIDSWLRTIFLKHNLMRSIQPIILITGRYELIRLNSRWSELQAGMEVIRLSSFSRKEAEAYLAKFRVDPKTYSARYEMTHGLPLFLNAVVKASSSEIAVPALKERIFEEIETEWRSAFVDMAVPDGFNLDIVQKVVGNEEKARALYDRLRCASFVESRAGLLHYVPVVRQVLLRSGELESPKRMAQIRERLAKS